MREKDTAREFEIDREAHDEIDRRYQISHSPAPGSKPKRPLTEVQKIVLVWKITEGYDKNDKKWDRLNFARCSKSARTLYEFFENWETAADCIEEVFADLTSKGLTCTIETIVKRASLWKIEKEGRHNGKLRHKGDGNFQIIK